MYNRFNGVRFITTIFKALTTIFTLIKKFYAFRYDYIIAENYQRLLKQTIFQNYTPIAVEGCNFYIHALAKYHQNDNDAVVNSILSYLKKVFILLIKVLFIRLKQYFRVTENRVFAIVRRSSFIGVSIISKFRRNVLYA